MSNRKIVCKLHCQSVKASMNESGAYAAEEFEMYAVSDPANKEWSDATPSAQFRATISNKAAWGVVLPGKRYLVTIEECAEDA